MTDALTRLARVTPVADGLTAAGAGARYSLMVRVDSIPPDATHVVAHADVGPDGLRALEVLTATMPAPEPVL